MQYPNEVKLFDFMQNPMQKCYDAYPVLWSVLSPAQSRFPGSHYPDFQQVLLKARKDAQVYHSKYMDNMTPFMMCQQVAGLFQEYTQSGGVRPFGLGLIMAGYDEENGC